MLVALLLACAPGSEPVPDAPPEATMDCASAPRVTWETWGQGFFRTWCGACHTATAQDRNDAPGGVDFASRAEVAAWKARIRQRVLVDQDMPVGGGLAPDDLALLDVMLSCDF